MTTRRDLRAAEGQWRADPKPRHIPKRKPLTRWQRFTALIGWRKRP